MIRFFRNLRAARLLRRIFSPKPKHDRYLVLNIVAFNRPKIYYK